MLTGKKLNAVGSEEQQVQEIISKHKNINLQVHVGYNQIECCGQTCERIEIVNVSRAGSASESYW